MVVADVVRHRIISPRGDLAGEGGRLRALAFACDLCLFGPSGALAHLAFCLGHFSAIVGHFEPFVFKVFFGSF